MEQEQADLIFEKLLSYFPERTPEQFDVVWKTSVIHEGTGVISLETDSVSEFIEKLQDKRKFFSNYQFMMEWLYDVIKEWYVTIHGAVLDGLDKLRRYFTAVPNKMDEIKSRFMMTDFYEYVYQEAFTRHSLTVKVVKYPDMMDFAVHFTWYLWQRYNDKSMYLLTNAIMRYRNSWADWLEELLGFETVSRHGGILVPDVPDSIPLTV